MAQQVGLGAQRRGPEGCTPTARSLAVLSARNHSREGAVTEQHRSERLSFLRPPAVPGAEFLIAYDSFRPWHVFHERYEVCACRTAAARWRYRGKSQFLN